MDGQLWLNCFNGVHMIMYMCVRVCVCGVCGECVCVCVCVDFVAFNL